MKKVKVTNVGKRKKSRLGVTLSKDESQEVTVNSRDYLVLKAAKSFQVEVLEDDKEQDNSGDNDGHVEIDDPLQELQEKNIDDYVAYVKENEMDVDTAIDVEKQGKDRKSLVEQLESLKEG